ncbi:hypothetical protein [Acidianus bottle-shaped virus 2 strain ABV2]|uniref:Uncharacterized protein n=1 Tax=Acidianus bottle-shaped virus 2 strain ABV2 TaxID=1732173 RepID=A0A0N9PCN1_9VIRU|nr:hypothetical protein AVU01_gp44 [Acidianus bottle-shaped virus 2 strain ABV2]ALG96792.1 hypothetical protein [Acidianus bottle-shaped virus 2 strain ABV2]
MINKWSLLSIIKCDKIMSYANNNGTFPTPQYISAIDLTTENKQKFTKYFNYTVFNFAKSFSNPLILPFTINIDVIFHGSIDLGANKFISSTFAVNQVVGSKFHITGEGTSYFWYRYGIIDPASFNLILQTAISDQNYLVVDALLHTRSITEAIDVIINNKSLWGIIAEGIDWQLNEIGAKDFFAYLSNNAYDSRKVAQFSTILAYIDPDALTKVGIPVYTYDNPNKTFEVYLEYFPTSYLEPIYSELNVQSSEIGELFTQSSELFIETNSLNQELAQLSENLILFTNAGQIVNEILKITHLFKAVLIVLKILQHVVKTISPVSELTILSDVGHTLDEILGMASEAITAYTSEFDTKISKIDHELLEIASELDTKISEIIPNINSESSESSSSESSQSSNNSGGLLGGL